MNACSALPPPHGLVINALEEISQCLQRGWGSYLLLHAIKTEMKAGNGQGSTGEHDGSLDTSALKTMTYDLAGNALVGWHI